MIASHKFGASKLGVPMRENHIGLYTFLKGVLPASTDVHHGRGVINFVGSKVLA